MASNTEQENIVVAASPIDQAVIAIPARSIRWSAIIGGVVVTSGIWLLLHALGMGIGLTAIDPNHPDSLRGVGIGTGIWSFIVPLIALFAGGMTTGYYAGLLPRVSALIHGVVLWSFATIISLLLVIWMLSGLLGSAARAGGQVVMTGSAAVQSIAGMNGNALDRLGLDENDLIAPLNERLRAAGKPTVTADQLRAALSDALRTAVREGRLDRDILVQSLAEDTALTRDDAQDIANAVARQWEQRAGTARDLGTAAQQTALAGAEAVGKALLALFILLAVGLGAAIGGVFVALSRQRRDLRS